MSAEIFPATYAIDDCWNRIGIRGDQSCEQLVRHVHCRNCEVYASNAANLLDRIPLSNASEDLLREPSLLSGGPTGERDSRKEGEPLLLFRVADEWFGFPARFVAQVAEVGPIHSLPKLRSKAVMGLANIRGQLTVCVSLARLLDLAEASTATQPRRDLGGAARLRAETARFVVTRDVNPERARERRGDEITVFPVDEVHGIERFGRDAHRAVPSTLMHAAAVHTRSMLDWKGRSVGVLDSILLFETLRRSLG